MGKVLTDTVLDGLLDQIKDNCNQMDALPSEPADRAAVIANTLASQAMVTGDFTKANGDVSGRKVTVAAKSTVSITATGSATHVSLVSASILLAVTTCTSLSLTSGQTVNFPAWDIEVQDPT